MAPLARTLVGIAVLAAGCAHPAASEPPREPAADGDAPHEGGLPEGKSPAPAVSPPGGLLVTRVDEDQMEMVYEQSGAFSAEERLRAAVEGSSTAFRHEPIGAGASTFHDLFGGRREPDPFLVVEDRGEVRVGKVYPADPGILEDAGALMQALEEDPEAHGESCEPWEQLVERDPAMPLLHELLAGCYQAAGDMERALAALREELAINPTYARAHLAMASAIASAQTLEETRRHLVLALLYDPGSDETRRWVNESGALPGTTAREERFSPRLDIQVDEVGFVVVRSPESQPWIGEYARCKAAFRHAPEVRMAFGMTAGPYEPSLLEEMVCLRLAADAYAAGRAEGRPAEVVGELLAGAVERRELDAAAFFEVIGVHDPDMMKMLPDELTSRVIAWIEGTVLVEQPQGG